MTEPSMQQIGPHPQSLPPYRLLVGYHSVGAKVEGEFIVLDAQNRALIAVPLRGDLAEDKLTEAKDHAALTNSDELVSVPVNIQGAEGKPCRFTLALPNPVTLEGRCSARTFLGQYRETRPKGAFNYVLPGLQPSLSSSGLFYLSVW